MRGLLLLLSLAAAAALAVPSFTLVVKPVACAAIEGARLTTCTAPQTTPDGTAFGTFSSVRTLLSESATTDLILQDAFSTPLGQLEAVTAVLAPASTSDTLTYALVGGTDAFSGVVGNVTRTIDSGGALVFTFSYFTLGCPTCPVRAVNVIGPGEWVGPPDSELATLVAPLLHEDGKPAGVFAGTRVSFAAAAARSSAAIVPSPVFVYLQIFNTSAGLLVTTCTTFAEGPPTSAIVGGTATYLGASGTQTGLALQPEVGSSANLFSFAALPITAATASPPPVDAPPSTASPCRDSCDALVNARAAALTFAHSTALEVGLLTYLDACRVRCARADVPPAAFANPLAVIGTNGVFSAAPGSKLQTKAAALTLVGAGAGTGSAYGSVAVTRIAVDAATGDDALDYIFTTPYGSIAARGTKTLTAGGTFVAQSPDGLPPGSHSISFIPLLGGTYIYRAAAGEVAIVRVDVPAAGPAGAVAGTATNLYVFFFAERLTVPAAALDAAAAAAVGACKAACHAAAEGDLAALAGLGAAAVAAIDQQVEEGFWVERFIVVGVQSCRANCDSAARG